MTFIIFNIVVTTRKIYMYMHIMSHNEMILTSKIVCRHVISKFCHDKSTFCSSDQSSISSCQQVNSCIDMWLIRFCNDMPTFRSVDQNSTN